MNFLYIGYAQSVRVKYLTITSINWITFFPNFRGCNFILNIHKYNKIKCVASKRLNKKRILR